MKTNKGTTRKRKVSRDILTKSLLETIARKGVQEAATKTIKVMGFNVIARDGWIVREFPDKRVERISPIPDLIEPK